ncbi:MAG: hypothetical protein LBI94_01000, partial [Treponema sp.]|nr:hypothetical protein [Treponema sp.]
DAAIEGIGNLAIYDTALRLGFRLNIYPKKIFLHSGAKEGAKKLGFELRPGSFTAPSGKTYQHPYLDKGDLSPPSAVSTLPEYELENILCVCKECI